ncbi:MAG: hypothetical protein JJU11_13635, partial [Candidatus Sumerlaeia bacterium]|nr:hypothetical protein [Candidatus Sumerlaeia bacterium]
MRTVSVVSMMMLGVYGFAAEVPKGPEFWDQFAPEPLHIISPENPSVSNPPLVHWQAHPDARSYRIVLESDGYTGEWSTEWNFLTTPDPLPKGEYRLVVEALDQAGRPMESSEVYTFELSRPHDGMNVDLNTLTLTPGAPVAYSDEVIEEIRGATGSRGELRDKLIELARQPREGALVDPREPERFPDGV